MKERRLHIVVGLPRAGKSTLCRTLGFPIVEGDAVRKALKCFPYNVMKEEEVQSVMHTMVDALFEAGHKDVILDDCSETSAKRNRWCEYERIFHEVRTSEAECCKRAVERDQDYLVPVIQSKAAVLTWPLDAPMTLDSTGKAVPQSQWRDDELPF